MKSTGKFTKKEQNSVCVVVFYVSRRLFDGAGVCLRQVKDSCWHLSDGYSVLSSLSRCHVFILYHRVSCHFEERDRSAS